MRKVFLCLSFFVVLGAAFVVWRTRPIMRPSESYNHFFPKEKFLQKVASPVPAWMQEQLDRDFANVEPIFAEKVTKAYFSIAPKVPEVGHCLHLRILDNVIYKYCKTPFDYAVKENGTELALKTLVSQIAVPNLDLLIVPMDGIPETCVEPNFYEVEEQIPILGFARLQEPHTHSIVLIPDQIVLGESWFRMAQEIENLERTTSVHEKIPKAFWRGGISDVPIAEQQSPILPSSLRLSFCRFAKEHGKVVDAAFYTADSPIQKALLAQEGLLTSFASKEEHLRYKYQPVFDGHMCTYPGYQWRLLSSSVACKQDSLQEQWFYRALLPYVHYIPIAQDGTDIEEKIAWAEAHPLEVEAIVQNAQKFVRENLLYEDGYRYLYLVLQRYATHQEIDFVRLKKETLQDPHWVNIQYMKRAKFWKWLHKKTGWNG